MLSITDMWKAGGSTINREPFSWARREGAPFIEAVCIGLNLSQGQVYLTRRGKHGGGTWAHWQIAFAYVMRPTITFEVALKGGFSRLAPNGNIEPTEALRF